MAELLLVLAIPVGVILGALLTTMVGKRRFHRTKGAFRTKLSVESGAVPGFRRGRRPYAVWAYWVHGVLVVRRGVFSSRTDHLLASSAGDVRPVSNDRVSVHLRLDSGAGLVLVAAESDLGKLVGPFLMAELEHLTRADS
jgi:hypothetical protein